MKRILFSIFSIILILFISCNADPYKNDKKVHVVSVGIDYSSTYYERLWKNIDDAVQVGQCIKTISAEPVDVTYLIGTFPDSVKKYNLEDYEVLIPTYNNFLTTVQKLKATSKKNDVNIFYLSCHGDTSDSIKIDNERYSYGKNKADAYIILLSSDTQNIVYYNVNDFIKDIKDIPGAKVVIADCCFSGALVQDNNVTVNTDLYDLNNLSDVFLSKKEICANASIYCLASGLYHQPVYIGDGLHSHFTEVLLKALGWNDSDLLRPKVEKIKCTFMPYLTLNDLSSWIYSNGGVFQYDGGKMEQKPIETGASSDVVLFDINWRQY